MKYHKMFVACWLVLWIFPNNAISQDSAGELIKIIEDVQHPNRQGLDPFTLEEIMDRFGVPGVSVAVIKDFRIHWC